MLPPTGAEDGQRFMGFMLEDKIGVIKLPVTGNPHIASALIVHPQGVCSVSFTSLLTTCANVILTAVSLGLV